MYPQIIWLFGWIVNVLAVIYPMKTFVHGCSFKLADLENKGIYVHWPGLSDLASLSDIYIWKTVFM